MHDCVSQLIKARVSPTFATKIRPAGEDASGSISVNKKLYNINAGSPHVFNEKRLVTHRQQ